MKTIEARLDHLQLYAICEEDTGLTWAGGRLVSATKQLATERSAIIADWNATEKAMKAVIARYYRTYKAGWYCHTCGGDELCRPECHTPDNCPVAAAQAALARMTGLHETQDVV